MVMASNLFVTLLNKSKKTHTHTDMHEYSPIAIQYTRLETLLILNTINQYVYHDNIT